jgi:hypothetical protein
MQQEMVGMLGRDSFTKLLQCPGRRRMFRDIDVQEAAGGMFHEHKDVEEAESRRDHHTEVACNDGLGMIAHKGLPALEHGPIASACICARFAGRRADQA